MSGEINMTGCGVHKSCLRTHIHTHTPFVLQTQSLPHMQNYIVFKKHDGVSEIKNMSRREKQWVCANV